MKRVLITGATGFLGGAAARELQDTGWEVITTGRNADLGEKLRRGGFTFERCDLAREPEVVGRLVENCAAVVHCAALSSPWGRRRAFHEANVVATQNVLSACSDSGARLVHISSPSVSFGFEHHRQLREDAPWPEPPANHYIATKREAEMRVRRATQLASIILRPKALIGRGDTTLLPRILRAAKRGTFPTFIGSDPLLDLTSVDDAAAAIRLAVEAPEVCWGKIYHITGGQPLPLSEALTLLFDACGCTVRFRPLSVQKALGAATLLEWISHLATAGRWEPPLTRYSVGSLAFEQSLDISAARRDLGYAPSKDIREALSECGLSWRAEQVSKS